MAELLITEASSAGQHRPEWTTALFAGSMVIIVATVALMAYVKARHVKRRIFWVGWLTADACAAVSLLPLGMSTTVTAFIGFALVIVFQAYFSTPYLKIGGRIYALTLSDSRPAQGREPSRTNAAAAT